MFSLILGLSGAIALAGLPAQWVVVDTGQDVCYDTREPIIAPAKGHRFFGQDAQYSGPQPAYHDNGDGSITDRNTGLIWSKATDTRKLSLDEATAVASRMTLGGHHDWRVPTIKELYSLIDFRGATGMAGPESPTAPPSAIPYIDTDYFDFRYGAAGERYIDAQWLSRTKYVSTTMDGQATLFGVNFADGRIKGYGLIGPGRGRPGKKFYARYVRGGPYGENQFADNGDGTVTDRATGLIWMQADSGHGMDWEHALQFAENLKFAGHDDWRLPNAKELQSLVDYTRSPDATHSAAIDPIFKTTAITNEAGQRDWPFFWTSTTHLDGPNAAQAVYVAFGRAIGSMHGEIMDVHGAGAQRSDPKTGSARIGHGPQGDAQRVQNFVRCVRGGNVTLTPTSRQTSIDQSRYPQVVRVSGIAYRPEKVTAPDRSPGAMMGFDSSPPTEQARDLFIQRLDRNHDGKVSRSEFDGPADGFSHFDRNRDGFVDSDEAPTGPPPDAPR
jgi:hypothetical protein